VISAIRHYVIKISACLSVCAS